MLTIRGFEVAILYIFGANILKFFYDSQSTKMASNELNLLVFTQGVLPFIKSGLILFTLFNQLNVADMTV